MGPNCLVKHQSTCCCGGIFFRGGYWDDPLEEGMTTHSSILAWRIPGVEEPGGLQSKGSQRVGHDWSDLACSTQHLSQ